MRTVTLVNAGGYRCVLAQAIDLGETRKQVSMMNRCSPLLRTMFVLFTTAAVSTASNIYSVSPIHFPSGFTNVSMCGINNSGQVAGYGANSADLQHAFIGTTSGSTTIPLPFGWSGAYGTAINASGQVAGYVVAGSVKRLLPPRQSRGISQRISPFRGVGH